MINFEECRKSVKTIKNKEKKIKENNTGINSNIESIALKKKSIAIEELLNNFPSQAVGTIDFNNKLNEKFESFDSFQFNKISRYVVFVENIEKEYNKLVKKCEKTYLKNPDSRVYGELVEKYNLLSINYQFLKILTEEIEGDKLLFNKVYNELEDKGLFLSKIDSFKIEAFGSIVRSLNKSVNLLENVDSSLGSMTNKIGDIGRQIRETNNILWDSNAKLGKLERHERRKNRKRLF